MRTRSPLPLRSGRGRSSAAPLLAAAAVLAALVLAGCSGGAADEAAPAPLSTAVSAAATGGASASADPSAGSTAQVVTTMTAFHAPSNNIFCYLAPVEGRGPYARCDIKEKTWTADPPEAGCAGDWGGAAGTRGSVGVGDDEAAVLCATDTLVETPGEELAYGSSISMGAMTCTVTEKTGMTCKNAETGRGFSVMRAEYDLFG
ncbi:hypothetical protein [Quadrisphaera sp. INWT6]|uniref:hypothetical protein n=1 Tax=Quadrisphaera sp. INWT6 TaxID=2596917 RepID=UPI00189276F5|nr:hypothetical protein [Quadrisphaera sp. INWT6]MBF5080427.1 hypothetical protein [Quadrisphaera sp. INWT6]